MRKTHWAILAPACFPKLPNRRQMMLEERSEMHVQVAEQNMTTATS